MDPAELERLIDRQLRALPAPRAPQTLLPRVLTAAHTWQQRPWYTRAWLTWPLGWQLASAAAFVVVLVAAGAWLADVRMTVVEAVTTSSAGLAGDVISLAQRGETIATAVWVLWRTLFEPLVAYATALLILMGTACAGLATALNRIAPGRAYQP